MITFAELLPFRPCDYGPWVKAKAKDRLFWWQASSSPNGFVSALEVPTA